jgi:hypothetical protein
VEVKTKINQATEYQLERVEEVGKRRWDFIDGHCMPLWKYQLIKAN